MAPMMGKMMFKTYAPVFEQINLSEDQGMQLRDLILKKNAGSVSSASVASLQSLPARTNLLSGQ